MQQLKKKTLEDQFLAQKSQSLLPTLKTRDVLLHSSTFCRPPRKLINDSLIPQGQSHPSERVTVKRK